MLPSWRRLAPLPVCLGKVESDAGPDQLVAFAGCVRQALAVDYRDLPSAALDQSCNFQLLGGIRDGWPLDAQHFAEQALSDPQRVIVAAIAHHQQPTRQPLLEIVR